MSDSYTSLANEAIEMDNLTTMDSSNNLLVCDRLNNRVQQFSLDGRFTRKSVTHLPNPRRLATTPDERILVTNLKEILILK